MKSDTVIISIHPCHIEKIFSGVKLYEYRKAIPSNIQNLIIYATAPIKQIVAIIEVDSVLTGMPNEIWNITKGQSGLSKKTFMSYFNHRTVANAIKFKTIHRLDTPKSLTTLNNIKYPPQSYVFINETMNEVFDKLLRS